MVRADFTADIVYIGTHHHVVGTGTGTSGADLTFVMLLTAISWCERQIQCFTRILYWLVVL